MGRMLLPAAGLAACTGLVAAVAAGAYGLESVHLQKGPSATALLQILHLQTKMQCSQLCKWCSCMVEGPSGGYKNGRMQWLFGTNWPWVMFSTTKLQNVQYMYSYRNTPEMRPREWHNTSCVQAWRLQHI
jgi:hypothetical protein